MVAVAVKRLSEAIISAGRSVREDGATGTPAPMASIWAPEDTAFNGNIKGSLLELKSGELAVVPPSRGLVSRGDQKKLTVDEGAGGHEKDEEWLTANVTSVVLGVLAYGGHAGNAAKLTYGGKFTASLAPRLESPITKVLVSVAGGAPTEMGATAALDKLGLKWRPWQAAWETWRCAPAGACPRRLMPPPRTQPSWPCSGAAHSARCVPLRRSHSGWALTPQER